MIALLLYGEAAMTYANFNIALLKEGLHYLHVSELKDWCTKLSLTTKGKKAELIFRIIKFIESGERVSVPSYPTASLANNNKISDLKCDALMLKGAYKNDLKTRVFFKDLIGSHFHFTAFGIDWLEHRWMAGLPPTYQEFAEMWKMEYMARKNIPRKPKVEWAYINFVKQYLIEKPYTNREDILKQWNIKRHEHKNYVDKFFARIL